MAARPDGRNVGGCGHVEHQSFRACSARSDVDGDRHLRFSDPAHEGWKGLIVRDFQSAEAVDLENDERVVMPLGGLDLFDGVIRDGTVDHTGDLDDVDDRTRRRCRARSERHRNEGR